MDIKGIIFDLDGTLLNTLGDIRASMNRILEAKGHPTHTLQEYHFYVGAGIYKLCEAVLPDANRTDSEIKEYIELFRADYKDHWNELTEPYPGIHELLRQLQNQGYELAVLSNKPDYFTKPMTDYYFPDISFVYVQGNLPELPAKPDPESAKYLLRKLSYPKENYAFVGDSDIDIQTGLNLGMLPIGVSWGFRPVVELIQTGAAHVINHAEELLKIIR
ncbi:MAG: HAD family hydrolase [Candidatus Cloacimonetes bacterium]|nr:HAD family hydrolase [Candidatus Cloacimonadota bacterium]